jgi:hypothetical protein
MPHEPRRRIVIGRDEEERSTAAIGDLEVRGQWPLFDEGIA